MVLAPFARTKLVVRGDWATTQPVLLSFVRYGYWCFVIARVPKRWETWCLPLVKSSDHKDAQVRCVVRVRRVFSRDFSSASHQRLCRSPFPMRRHISAYCQGCVGSRVSDARLGDLVIPPDLFGQVLLGRYAPASPHFHSVALPRATVQAPVWGCVSKIIHDANLLQPVPILSILCVCLIRWKLMEKCSFFLKCRGIEASQLQTCRLLCSQCWRPLLHER